MTTMHKKHGATIAYHNFLLARAKVDFQWGTNDCALFAADGIEAITGIDIAEDFRGKYIDEAGALAAIKSVAGGSSIADAAAYCAEKHAMKEWPKPLFAQRGDLVVFENGANLIAGLVHLSGRHVVTVGPEGLYRFCITSVKRAWHTGAWHE